MNMTLYQWIVSLPVLYPLPTFPAQLNYQDMKFVYLNAWGSSNYLITW